ncbi:MAG: hypothetical protein ACI9F9_000723 [Candidatus Paceibacteria bacterium]|jgi:hypothetical protein
MTPTNPLHLFLVALLATLQLCLPAFAIGSWCEGGSKSGCCCVDVDQESVGRSCCSMDVGESESDAPQLLEEPCGCMSDPLEEPLPVPSVPHSSSVQLDETVLFELPAGLVASVAVHCDLNTTRVTVPRASPALSILLQVFRL